MKAKKVFLGIALAAFILSIVLIAMKAYYVVVALIVGTLIIAYREFWSLLRWKKLPPFDERVRDNVNKSVRNGFVFFAAASAILMLCFSIDLRYVIEPDAVHVMSCLFLTGGLVYLLSYLYYDRAEPGLGERDSKMLKIFLLIAGMALATFIVSVILHNAVSALLGVEEAVFFVIAVIHRPTGACGRSYRQLGDIH